MSPVGLSRPVSVVLALITALVVTWFSTGITPALASSTWTVQVTQNALDNGSATDNTFTSVTAPSASDVWAAGIFATAQACGCSMDNAMTQHWDGTAWSLVPVPAQTDNGCPVGASSGFPACSAGASTDNDLFGISARAGCAAPCQDVWSVGSYTAASGDYEPLILQYTVPIGQSSAVWQAVAPASNLQGAADNAFNGVAALSASNIWAVGFKDDDIYGNTSTLIEQSNGSTWTTVASPNQTDDGCPSGASVGFASCIAGNPTDTTLQGVAGSGPSDVWAVGGYYNTALASPSSRTLIEHFDGSTWAVVPSPNLSPGGDLGDNELLGISVISGTDAWAVGTDDLSSGGEDTVALHWTPCISGADIGCITTFASCPVATHAFGCHWVLVPSPNPGIAAGLSSVSAVSSGDVWAVGQMVTPSGSPVQLGLAEHWNGTSWLSVPTASTGDEYQLFFGVAAADTSHVWAVGQRETDDFSPVQTFAESWNTSGASIPSISLDAGSDSGLKGDNTTNVTKPQFDGTAQPGVGVTVTDENNLALCTTSADATTGAWHCSASTVIANGSHTITVTASNSGGPVAAAMTLTVDTAAPSMTVAGTGTSGSGSRQTTIAVQDVLSGLTNITVTKCTNCTYTVNGTKNAGSGFPDAYAFKATTSQVPVVFTQTSNSQPATLGLSATDAAGNKADPDVLFLGRSAGTQVAAIVPGVGQDESQIDVLNGTPGITTLIVSVNGHVMQYRNLASGQTSSFSIGWALQPGTANRVALVGIGPATSSATVVIGPPPEPVGSYQQVRITAHRVRAPTWPTWGRGGPPIGNGPR